MLKYRLITTSGEKIDLYLSAIAYIQIIEAEDPALNEYRVSLVNGHTFYVSPADYQEIDKLTDGKKVLLG